MMVGQIKKGKYMKAKGSCYCKAVGFTFDLSEKHFAACHCDMCKKLSGGPVLAVKADGGIEIHGEDNLSIFNSSDWAERGFCTKCGTNLFYRLKTKDYWNFNLGTIDNNAEYEFVSQIFTDKKASHYSFSNETKMMTESEVLAAFGHTE